MATLRTGDGRRGTDMGPLVTREHRDKVAGYVQAGVDAGAELVVDGRASNPGQHFDGARTASGSAQPFSTTSPRT